MIGGRYQHLLNAKDLNYFNKIMSKDVLKVLKTIAHVLS